MTTPALEILYEDNHLLVVNKPAGLPTMGAPEGTPTLLTLAKEYIKHRHSKPGNVYLGVMSRLDAPVSGVVLLARTSKAAARMTAQFHAHTVQKLYWALVETPLLPPSGTYRDWLVHDERHRRVRIAAAEQPGAKAARLDYRQLSGTVPFDRALSGRVWLVEVLPETGRKHQIRVQMAHHGHPLLGDRKYGSRRPFAAGIALHARRLVIAHPVRGETLAFEAPLPRSWADFGLRG
jgi:23S rRNA pseudouridine1911/1915/1917 synthase